MRRGAVLIEIMLSLAIFAMAAMVLSGVMSRAAGASDRAAWAAQAEDLARSAMARIEAGIATPQSLNGPVRDWDSDREATEGDEQADPFGGAAVDMRADQDERWHLEIETERSSFSGLAKVSVTAMKRDEQTDRRLSTYTLHQLVRLRDTDEDEIGEQDELMDAAEQGDRRGGQQSGQVREFLPPPPPRGGGR